MNTVDADGQLDAEVDKWCAQFVQRSATATTITDVSFNLYNGQAGLSIVDNGSGDYTAGFSYNPLDAQSLGLYDLYFEVNDNTGTASAIDGYNNNLEP